MKNVVVIGGGASGLVAGITASKENKVIILERNKDCAKKILSTGNGKCNYFNSDINVKNYYTDDYDKLKVILSEENINKAITFLDKIGIIPRIKNGYYYPYSNQATTIKSMLLSEVKNRNIKVFNDVEVKEVIKKDNIFIINKDKECIKADKLILATGSIAGVKNVENTGLRIAKSFNLPVIEPLPSLVQLYSDDNFKDCSKIRCDASISLYVNEEFVTQESGELQFTDYGISGICTFNISGAVARALRQKKKVVTKINFLPILDKNNFISWLDERCKKLSNRDIVELLESVVNYKLVYSLLRKAKIDKNSNWLDLTIKQKNILRDLLFSYPLIITKTNSFDRAQVVTGGISMSCINPNTLESSIKNLYITGELLNVDGKCGGFNLGFAWITGLIAGDLK